LLHGLALLDSGTPKSVADLCAEAQYQVKTGAWMTNVIDELTPDCTRDSATAMLTGLVLQG
jgi:hypothetical protein